MSRNISASMKTVSVWLQVLIKKKEPMEIFLQAGKIKKRTVDKSVYRLPKVRPKNLTIGGRYTAIRFFVKFYQKQEKRLAPATVMIPATQMERELMAPSTGPISIARAVPMPWAAVPMASWGISFWGDKMRKYSPDYNKMINRLIINLCISIIFM